MNSASEWGVGVGRKSDIFRTQVAGHAPGHTGRLGLRNHREVEKQK
jgi:hypothetical protein